MLLGQLLVHLHVAASLPHHPHGRAVHGLSARRAQKKRVIGRGRGGSGGGGRLRRAHRRPGARQRRARARASQRQRTRRRKGGRSGGGHGAVRSVSRDGWRKEASAEEASDGSGRVWAETWRRGKATIVNGPHGKRDAEIENGQRPTAKNLQIQMTVGFVSM